MRARKAIKTVIIKLTFKKSVYYIPGMGLSVSHILLLFVPHMILLSSNYRQENISQEGFFLIQGLDFRKW